MTTSAPALVEVDKPGLSTREFARWGLIFLLLILIAVPLVVLLITSFLPRGGLPFQSWTFSLDNYRDVLFHPTSLTLLTNTLVFAGGSVAMAIIIGVVFAFLTERTDVSGQTLVRVLMFSWMAVPPLVFGYGWILLLNPGNGVLNNLLMGLFGLKNPPLTPYSIWALIIIAGLSLVPTAYVMIGGLLKNMDPVLEDAALICGASRATVLRRITVPLLTPGILSVGIFLTMAMVQSFDLPMIIGLTARVPVLSTRIYTAAAPDSGLPHYGLAAAFGVCLLFLAMGLMALYFRMVRVSERFRTITGKGFRPRRIVLRPAARLMATAALGLYFVIMLMPLLILLWASLLQNYQSPSISQLGNVTLDAYRAILGQPQTLRVLTNTVLLFLGASTAVMVLSCFISWFSVRSPGRGGRILDILSFAPIAIPPIVMAIAVLLFFLKTPINGTLWVLIIGHMTVFLAFGTRSMNSAFIQIHKELEDAAVVSGASWFSSLRYVLFPMVWPHILNAWLWVASHSARDLTFPLMLLTSTNVVASTAIYMRWDFPDLPGAAALSIMLVLGLMVIVIPVQLYVMRRTN